METNHNFTESQIHNDSVTIAKEFMCAICNELSVEPRSYRACGARTCRKCIEQWLQNKNVCPVSRCTPVDFQSTPDTMKFYNLIKIQCLDCGIYVGISEYDNHVKNEANAGYSQGNIFTLRK